MCGRYALSLTANNVRVQVEEQLERPVQAWEDEEDYNPARGYNIAPRTRNPIILRGGASGDNPVEPATAVEEENGGEHDDAAKKLKDSSKSKINSALRMENMQWGLIPHWMKRPQESGAQLKTINARDDTVQEGGSMWKSIRGRKRCIVIAEGFYEWLKKGNDRLPYHTKRKDGKLMCFAGLWDSVTYEGEKTPLHTYTIITTNSNKQLSFLHDRMPVILPSAEAIETWLDTSDGNWSPKLSALLKPFEGELECYPVPKEVGKVGNQSADFLKPVSERKGNIASFFGKQIAKQEAKEEERANDKAKLEHTKSTSPTQSKVAKSTSPETKPSSTDKKKADIPQHDSENVKTRHEDSKQSSVRLPKPKPKPKSKSKSPRTIKGEPEAGTVLPLNPDDNEKITRSKSASRRSKEGADTKAGAIVLDDSADEDSTDLIELDNPGPKKGKRSDAQNTPERKQGGKAAATTKAGTSNSDSKTLSKRKGSTSSEPQGKKPKTKNEKNGSQTAPARSDGEGNQRLENYFEVEDED